MPKAKSAKSIPASSRVEMLIRVIRGRKVILDSDMAALYGVETGHLNRAVKRNLSRFPEEFMFQITEEESLKCHFGISKAGRGGRRFLPYVFTEHGVVMLSSVLNSERAVHVNILVVKAFIRMRELIVANKDLAVRIQKLESAHERTASVMEVLIDDIQALAAEVKQMKALPDPKKRGIGFGVPLDD